MDEREDHWPTFSFESTNRRQKWWIAEGKEEHVVNAVTPVFAHRVIPGVLLIRGGECATIQGAFFCLFCIRGDWGLTGL